MPVAVYSKLAEPMSYPEKLSLLVHHGDETEGVHACAIHVARDGTIYANWRGLLYPVVGNAIDTANEPITTDELALSDTPASDISNASFQWVEGIHESYVFLTGTGLDLEDLVARLKRAGVAIVRSGRHLGADIDGAMPDWFVKVETPDGGLASRFEAIGPTARSATLPDNIRADFLREELTRVKAERERLALELSRTRDATTTTIAEALARAEAAETKLARAIAAPSPEPQPAAASSVRQVLSRHRALEVEVETVFAVFLPFIEPLRGTPTRIATEWRERSALYAVLRELDGAERLGSSWKKLKGVDGWWERHVSNGLSDAGRVYAQRTDKNRWRILVGDKVEQGNDIEWLSRQ